MTEPTRESQPKNHHQESTMKTEESTLIEFTFSNPPQIRSHESWEEVYELISDSSSRHPDPYYLQTGGHVVVLVDDGKGAVGANLLSTEEAFLPYTMMGGVWVKLSAEA
jgi:hypothetical protein